MRWRCAVRVGPYEGVAKVRVRHFVDVDQVEQVLALQGHLVVHEVEVAPRHEADVLHGAADGRDGDLVVLGEREGHADLFREPLEHRRRLRKGAREPVGRRRRGAPQRDRNASDVAERDPLKTADRQARQVGRARVVQAPAAKEGAEG